MGAVVTLRIDVLRKSPVLWIGDKRLVSRSLRADALLLYVCLSAENLYQRNTLASLLWQDADTEHSRGSLRQLIRRLRNNCSELDEVLTFGRDKVEVFRGVIKTDLDEICLAFESSIESKLPKLDVDLDDLFSEFAGFSSSFDAWIAIQRNNIEERLQRTLMGVFENLGATAAKRTAAARALLNVCPTHEPACRHLMRAAVVSGDTGAAIKLYDDLYTRLDNDFDTEPTEETAQLIADIKLGKFEVESLYDADTIARPATPEIFVQEFELIAISQRAEATAKVLRYELIAKLSTFREWRLFDLDTGSTQRYRLEGLIAEVGDDFALIATLKLAPDDRIIWSERFEVGFENWNETQSYVARRIALAVNSRIGADRLSAISSNEFKSRTVFDNWVRAQSLILDWKPSKIGEGIDLLRETIEHAPEFGPAHSSLAMGEYLKHITLPGLVRSSERIDRSLYHARRALEIDPLDTRAHLSTAWAYAMKGQHDAAVFHFGQCLELGPNSIPGRMSCALGFSFSDRLESALEIIDETLILAPDMPPYLWGYAQNIWFLADRHQDAIAAGRRAGASISNLPAWQAATLWEAGDQTEATALARQFTSNIREDWHSQHPFDEEKAIEWFIGCFPLKNEAQSMRLKKGLSAALGA